MPPVAQSVVDTVPARASRLVQQRTQPAPELRVDVLASSLPPEVRVVAVAIGGNGAQEVGQLARRLEVVDVDEGAGWRGALVVSTRRSHHHRNYVVPNRTQVNVETTYTASGT